MTQPAASAEFRLECVPLTPEPPELKPGRPERDWMDAFAARHAYRCLPLTMANTTGWEVLCPFGFEAEWTGGMNVEDIRLSFDEGALYPDHVVASHFSHGVLTFHLGWMFRTPPGWALRASGTPNRPKDGIAALEGLIETDWLPYPFTMNWQFTRPGKVRFEKGEPFCFISPVPHRQIEAFQPVKLTLDQDPALAGEYEAWKEKRTDFNQRMAGGDPAALREAWQRFYFRGQYPDSDRKAEAHVNKRRLASLTEAPVTPQGKVDFRSWSSLAAARNRPSDSAAD